MLNLEEEQEIQRELAFEEEQAKREEREARALASDAEVAAATKRLGFLEAGGLGSQRFLASGQRRASKRRSGCWKRLMWR
jgi:hypothetical protein